MEISAQTINELLQMGGQYLLPIAALLRALYHGLRQKFPEGATEIAVASLITGLTSIVDNETPDLRVIVVEILGNSIFMAGLLTFIVVYLLRMPNRGRVVDGVVGGVVGLAAWAGWNLVLGNEQPWWTIPLFIVAGVAGFIALRALLRQIARLVHIATYFIVAGLVLMVGAGAILLIYNVVTAASASPTPLPGG